MSPRASKVRDAAINVTLTMVATLFLTFGTGLWASKETVADHKADIQAVTAKQAADIQSVNAKLERILDVLCQRQPAARTCGAPGDVRLP